MLRCCFPLLCAGVSWDALYRRALGAQTTVIDLVPVKKPMIDGSASWFVSEGVEVVLVSGVKGTSPDEVTKSVKRQAVRVLQQCGDGDAAKGCHKIRRCVDAEGALKSLLRGLDLQVRLRLWGQSPTNTPVSSAAEIDGGAAGQKGGDVTHCSIYMRDAWEPHRHERHIRDVTTSSSALGTWLELLREALNIVQSEAMIKSQQFAEASYKEAHLLLSSAGRLTQEDVFDSQAFLADEFVRPFAKDMSMRWLVFPTAYTVDFEFLRCKKKEEAGYDTIAGSCTLRDDAGNTEQWDVPFVGFKDKAGLVYNGVSSAHASPLQRKPQEEQRLMEEAALELLEAEGAISRVRSLKDSEFVPELLHSLWAQPLLQALLLQSSSAVLCGRLTRTCAEDYVKSCGRFGIDMWLNARCQTTTIPMTPRCLEFFDELTFLQESLPLELGSRAMMSVSMGPLRFGYHVATTLTGRVVTAVNCFHSAASALLALLPWCAATPLRSKDVDHTHQPLSSNKNGSQHQAEKRVASTPISSDSPILQQDAVPPSVVVRVLDVEASLKKYGVASGTFAAETVTYYDASGKKMLQFEQMDSLQGIERLVKCLRRSRGACFVPVGLVGHRRASLIVSYRALAGLLPSKAPPYIKRIRVPVPLVPNVFFSLRFNGLLDMERKEDALLNIFSRYAEDPAQWPLRPLVPCFFNRWRLTRGIIDAIIRHDPLFRYSLERVSGNKEEDMPFLLRLYSGDELKSETPLEEKTLLRQVRTCFAQYAAQWNLHFPPVDIASFLVSEFRKTFSFSARIFVSTLLQNSDITTQDGDVLALELHVTAGVKIRLAEEKGYSPAGPKESVSWLFLKQQFPELLPTTQLLWRIDQFFSQSGGGRQEMTFRCTEGEDAANGSSFCWELQRGVDGDRRAVVLDSAKGPSRFDALVALLDKVESQFGCVTPASERSVALPVTTRVRTIEQYQVALARKLNVTKIIHEYDKKRNVLIVKSIRRLEQSATDDVKVLRVIPLSDEHTIGVVMHRYYRRELHLNDPPMTKDTKMLSVMNLASIYTLCQKHFELALPPLEDSLIERQERAGWRVVLRLPGKLFALVDLPYVEYLYFGRGKHEGRRNVLCDFYRALHGEPPPGLERALSEVVCHDILSTENNSKTEVSTKVDNNNNNGNAGCDNRAKPNDIPTTKVKNSGGGVDMSMYAEIVRLIDLKFQTYVGYEGVTECRLSHLTGFSGRYIPRAGQKGECVELFHVPLQSRMWLPLQLLAVLLSCARQFVPQEELEECLLRAAATWPSLFLDATRSERLFCATFLRRYLGLWTFEENDVGVQAANPGAMYLVERTRRSADKRFEASLLLLQTPLSSSTVVFKKVLALQKSVTGSRAESAMWNDVTRQLGNWGEAKTQEDVDKAVLLAALNGDSGRGALGEEVKL